MQLLMIHSDAQETASRPYLAQQPGVLCEQLAYPHFVRERDGSPNRNPCAVAQQLASNRGKTLCNVVVRVSGKRRPVERRQAHDILFMHVGTFLQQPLNQFLPRSLSGNVQRRAAVTIASLDE
jgi:hypothetical protein